METYICSKWDGSDPFSNYVKNGCCDHNLCLNYGLQKCKQYSNVIMTNINTNIPYNVENTIEYFIDTLDQSDREYLRLFLIFMGTVMT